MSANHRDADDANPPRCCEHGGEGGWVRALAVATFDVGTGHTLEQVYPPDSLDEGDRQRVRMLAMPDCNTTQIGDCFYCFRTRKSHRMPLLSSSLLDQTFEYCYAFFRQERNEECARGMFQKSVVLVSRYPYVNFFERLVKVIGPLYFTHGPAVLEAVFASIEEWPAPCPGALCPLPFLSETVMFQVPDIDMPPQVASKYGYHRGVHSCALWPRARVKSLTRTLSGCGSVDFSHSSPNAARRASTTFASPDDARDSPRATRKPQEHIAGAGAVAGAVPPLAAADDLLVSEGDAAADSISGGISPTRGHDKGGQKWAVPDRENLDKAGSPILGSGAGGDAGGGVFWSGPAMGAGVLVSPGMQLTVEGGEEGQQGIGLGGARTRRRSRSSIGSVSLASVLCDSPSETWLTTPRSGSGQILALDGSGGSNLAQSCYYVADHDSDDDTDEQEQQQQEEGWQRDRRDGGAGSSSEGVPPGEEGRGSSSARDNSLTQRRESLRQGEDVERESATVAAELVRGHSSPGALPVGGDDGVTAAPPQATLLTGAGDGSATPHAASEARHVAAAPAGASTDPIGVVRPGVASGVQSRATSLPAPLTETGSGRSRATSHSPQRSAARATPSAKASRTPNAETTAGGLWSGLRAWANAAPEDPWGSPPPPVKNEATTASATITPVRSVSDGSSPTLSFEAGASAGRDGSRTSRRSHLQAGAMPSVAVNPGEQGSPGDGVAASMVALDATNPPSVERQISSTGALDDGKEQAAAVAEGTTWAAVVKGQKPPGQKESTSSRRRGSGAAADVEAEDMVRPSDAGGAENGKPQNGTTDTNGNGPGKAVTRGSPTWSMSVPGGGGGGAAADVGAGWNGDVDGIPDEGEGEGDDRGGRRPVRRSSYRLLHEAREGRLPTFTKINIHRSASNMHGGRSPFAEMLLADEARFRAKQGLFQSIGLYSIFGKKLVEHLWLLWELVLTGGPTLVVGSNVGASSAAILGMVSLASPVYYGGDFRPHFTTFDPDYREIVAAHDKVSKQQLWGSSVLGVQGVGSGTDANAGYPSMLLGVINPIFLRTLSRWPNAIVLPGAAGRNTSAGAAGIRKLQKELSEDSSSTSPKNRKCPTPAKEGMAAARPPPVRVQVVRAGASLEQVVGQDDRPTEPIIVARQQPVMVPDVAVLSRLLDPGCPYNPATAAAAAAAAAGSTPGQGRPPTPLASVVAAAAAAAEAEAAGGGKGGSETRGQWKDSLRAINDIILRRHFADLTRSFLAPFDKYFRRSRPKQPLSAWQHMALGRLSVYTEAELLLPKFQQDEFLTEMFVAGPPKSFAHVQWETLYKRFMDSPNFQPWFSTQRAEGIDRIRESNREICLETTAAGLVDACAPARLPQLQGKIKASIAKVWHQKGRSVDWELLEKMELHQKAVEAAIAPQSARGGATGSIQP